MDAILPAIDDRDEKMDKASDTNEGSEELRADELAVETYVQR